MKLKDFNKRIKELKKQRDDHVLNVLRRHVPNALEVLSYEGDREDWEALLIQYKDKYSPGMVNFIRIPSSEL